MAPNHKEPNPCSVAPIPSPNTRVRPVFSLNSKGKPLSGDCVVAVRELWGVSTVAESHTSGLAKLADIYMKWRYVTENRIGSWCELILTNHRTVNSHCVTAMAAFMCEGILTPEKRKRIRVLMVQIAPENRNYYCRYVPEIWSVFDSTGML